MQTQSSCGCDHVFPLPLLKLQTDSWFMLLYIHRPGFKSFSRKSIWLCWKLLHKKYRRHFQFLAMQKKNWIKTKIFYFNVSFNPKQTVHLQATSVQGSFVFSVFKHTRRPRHSTDVKNVSWILIARLYVCQGACVSSVHPATHMVFYKSWWDHCLGEEGGKSI